MKPSSESLLRLKDEKTFGGMFRAICAHGEAPVSEYEDETGFKQMTYRELERLSVRSARRLFSLLGPERRGRFVGLQLDNCPEWPALFWGLLMSGYHPLLLDFRASEDTLRQLLLETDAAALITNNEISPPSGVPCFRKDEIVCGEGKGSDQEPLKWGTRIAFCTSGTGADPQVFVFEEASIVENTSAFWYLTENSPFYPSKTSTIKSLAFLPFHHVFGFLSVYCFFSVLGATFVYLKDRSPLTLLRACQKHHVTHIYAVPLVWNNLATKVSASVRRSSWLQRWLFRSLRGLSLALQLFSPRFGRMFAYRVLFRSLHQGLLGNYISYVISGGAYLPSKTLKFLSSIGLPVLSGYGMTEAGIVAVDYDQGFRRRARQCVGKPLLSHEVRLQQRDDGLFREVFLKGPALHSGRMEKGQWQPASLVDGEWFSTGDLGELDGKGRLYLRGRSKDTIVTGSGENLSPDEIEDRFQGVEGIEKLAVLGMRSPVSDQEEITLVLQLGDPNPSEASRAKVADQIYRLNQKVPISKRIRRVIVSGDPLPTTTVGKVRRPLLKKFIEEKRSSYLPLELKRTVPDQPTALPAGRLRELKEEVRELFAEVLGRPPRAIREEAHFIDELGGDSLQALALANLLEKKYRVVVPDAMLQECASVKEIAEALHKLLTEGGYSSASGASGAVQPDRTPIASFEETKEYRAFRLRLDQAGAFNPYFVSHDSVVRDTSLIEGKEVVNFASYNYLGLSGHPEVTKAAEEASRKYGTSTSGSRLVLEKSLYQELESEIARWKHVEDALVLVSGHATNVTFVGNFCNKNDLICYDFFSHDSILQGCRLSRSESKAFPHNDFRALEEILLRNRNHYEKILVVVEGVYSADGDVAPIPEFVKLKKKYGLFLMVDEAHSSCVLGKKGEGVDGHFGLSPDDIDIRMGTLSKGLGSCGGYLAGKRSLIEYLRYNLSGFVFSVGIPPASAAAALASLRLIQRDHSMVERLHANIRTFLEEAHRRNFHTCLAGESAVIPIMVGEDLAAFVLSKRLRERGIFAGPMVFPSVPAGRARIRFFVTSEHKPEQIVFALDALKESALQERISLPGYQEKVS